MSWLRIDDEFTEHPKVLLLTDAALAFWVKVGCWLRRPINAKLSGFIPEALLPTITRKSADETRKLATELVNANAGGMFEVGLWIRCEGGYRVHDWDDFQPPEKMTPQEAARAAGQKSARSRREKYGSAQPKPERNPERLPNETEPVGERSTERPSESVRPNVSRTPRTPDPVPDPISRSKADDVDPKDLTGSARESEVPLVDGSSLDSSPPTRRGNHVPEPPIAAPVRPVAASVLSPARRASTKVTKAKPERFVPDDWQPNEAHRAKAQALGVILNQEVQKFRCHEFRVPKTDWDRTFFGWLLRAGESGTSSGARSFNSQRAPKMGEPGWRQQPDAGAVNDADYDYDYSQDEVSNG